MTKKTFPHPANLLATGVLLALVGVAGCMAERRPARGDTTSMSGAKATRAPYTQGSECTDFACER